MIFVRSRWPRQSNRLFVRLAKVDPVVRRHHDVEEAFVDHSYLDRRDWKTDQVDLDLAMAASTLRIWDRGLAQQLVLMN